MKTEYCRHVDVDSFTNVTPRFLVLRDDSISYDDGYGGRDNKKFMDVLSFASEEQLKMWVQENDSRDSYYSRTKYKIFEIRPVTIVKEISFNFEISGSEIQR